MQEKSPLMSSDRAVSVLEPSADDNETTAERRCRGPVSSDASAPYLPHEKLLTVWVSGHKCVQCSVTSVTV